MLVYQDYLNRKKEQYRKKFNAVDLNKNFIQYYESQERIIVSFCNKQGKEIERKKGRIGVTTGWQPCFLLMLTVRSLGSSYIIGKNDKIIK